MTPTFDRSPRAELGKVCGCARVIWNDALVKSRELYASDEKTSYPLLAKLWITQAKPTPKRPWLADASTMVLQQSVRDLDLTSTGR